MSFHCPMKVRSCQPFIVHLLRLIFQLFLHTSDMLSCQPLILSSILFPLVLQSVILAILSPSLYPTVFMTILSHYPSLICLFLLSSSKLWMCCSSQVSGVFIILSSRLDGQIIQTCPSLCTLQRLLLLFPDFWNTVTYTCSQSNGFKIDWYMHVQSNNWRLTDRRLNSVIGTVFDRQTKDFLFYLWPLNSVYYSYTVHRNLRMKARLRWLSSHKRKGSTRKGRGNNDLGILGLKICHGSRQKI